MLIYLEKAELIEAVEGRTIRSVSVQFPFPSIIRLSRWYRIPHRNILLSRKNILRRDGHRCQYCGVASNTLTVDHVVPRALGGGDSWENLVAACLRCNNSKSNRTPEKAGMRLRSVPRRPSHVSFIIHASGHVDERWKPYLFIE